MPPPHDYNSLIFTTEYRTPRVSKINYAPIWNIATSFSLSKSSGLLLSHFRSRSHNYKSRAKVVNFRYSFVFHTISPHSEWRGIGILSDDLNNKYKASGSGVDWGNTSNSDVVVLGIRNLAEKCIMT